MGMELKFGVTKFNELDFIILNDIFKLIKEEINNHQVNSCEINYNYEHLFKNFTMKQISEVFENIFSTSFRVENNERKYWERLTPTMGRETDDNIMFKIVNVKYLNENFFIDSTIKKD